MSEVSARRLSVQRLDLSPAERFSCRSTASGAHAAWVHVHGELDLASCPELKSQLHEAQLRARLIVIDLRGVTFIDCSGLRVLLAAESGQARTILVTGSVVSRLVELMGLSDHISIVDLDSAERGPNPPLELVPDNRDGDPGDAAPRGDVAGV